MGSTYGGDPGCQSSNPNCNETQLAADNAVNTLEPQLENPGAGDFRPSAGSNLLAVSTVTMAPFSWSDAPATPAVPEGTLDNSVPGDRAGEPRTTSFTPGAYVTASTSCVPLIAPYALPGTGSAPLAVLFFSNAAIATACTGAPTYAWSFGDGATSTVANPRHIYSVAGTYSWSLSIEADGASAYRSGQVTVWADTCTLDCVASAPTGGSVGSPFFFTCTAYPSAACQGPVTYDWDFGDGSAHSSLQSPTHVFSTEGTYAWILTVSVGAVQCTRTGTVTITTASPPVITLMKKVAPPFKVVVQGANLQNGITAYIDGVQWTSVVWKKATKIQLTGAIKAAVPKGTTHTFRFVNPDGGEATTTWGW